VEPVAEVPAAERDGRSGQRGRYGIDGGFAGLAVFAATEAVLAGTVAWAVRHRRPAVAALAGVGGAVVAGSAASYLYSTGPAKRAIWAQLLDELGLLRDRVELVDADARDLPFASASFDLVVSSLALSNIRDAGGRAQALREAVRVLRPGGRLRIVDDGAGRYAALLRDAGCTDVAVRQLDWRTWYGIPGHHLPLVAAARPPG
jgi:SAM-dependent methyltransferase